jgi:hypothetical protein
VADHCHDKSADHKEDVDRKLAEFGIRNIHMRVNDQKRGDGAGELNIIDGLHLSGTLAAFSEIATKVTQHLGRRENEIAMA